MLSEILAHYGANPPQSSGSMKCCFHQDRHSSASVDLEKGVFFCHTCGWGGDAISIVMRQENLEFKDAVSFAEGIAGGSDFTVRGKRGAGYSVPRVKGAKPSRYRNLPSWRRD